MPDFLLFAQHGWFDNSRAITRLAQAVATHETEIISPDLGYARIWLRMAPLIRHVEHSAIRTIDQYPHIPIRIIAHSMGGLLWLEVLMRHPEWWPRIQSLVLLGSPIGGAHVARIIDPLAWGIGIARDLGHNRRRMAEIVAAVIPTLVIAGDASAGSDMLITVGATQVRNARYVCLPGLWHPALRDHPRVAAVIRDCWNQPASLDSRADAAMDKAVSLIQRLRRIPGMTDAQRWGFRRATVVMRFPDGLALRTWCNPLGVNHVFLADQSGQCLFAGFVGWIHTEELRKTLEEIKRDDAGMLS